MNAMLQQTEEQLSGLPPWQRWVLIVGVALGIVAASWYIYLQELFEENAQLTQQITVLERKVKGRTAHLLGLKIAKKKRQIAQLSQNYEKRQMLYRRLVDASERLGLFLFEEGDFLRIMTQILQQSVSLGLRIDQVALQTIDRPVTAIVRAYRTMRIEGSGAFGPTVRLLWYAEGFKALLQVRSFHFFYDKDAQENRFVIEIEFYGEHV